MTDLSVPPSVLYAKPAVRSRDGLAAAQSRDAAAAGARILAQGGHAVDAAVAVSLALGTVEPWMSGLGGGGFATLYDAEKHRGALPRLRHDRAQGIDPADYPLTGGPTAEGFFGWPGVRKTATSSAPIPSRSRAWFPALPWRIAPMAACPGDLVQPAIALAERGLSLDLYGAMSLLVGPGARHVRSHARPLPAGRARAPAIRGRRAGILKLGRPIDTLKKLASPDGPERFYRGDMPPTWSATCRRPAASCRAPISSAIRRASSIRWRSPIAMRRCSRCPG